jgi:hypothetical protein
MTALALWVLRAATARGQHTYLSQAVIKRYKLLAHGKRSCLSNAACSFMYIRLRLRLPLMHDTKAFSKVVGCGLEQVRGQSNRMITIG